jgi:hypothetical protein
VTERLPENLALYHHALLGVFDYPLKGQPQVRIQLQTLIEVLLCLVGAALPQPHDPALAISIGVLWFLGLPEREVASKIGFGARPLFLALP